MFTHLRPALVLIVFFTVLTGIAYPFAMTGIAQGIFPHQSNGSLVEKDGAIIGSQLIGQAFESERYFHGRPSAVNYDASTSSGSNYGPTSDALLDQVKQRAAANGGTNVPADLLTASGSGLDPDLSPAGALAQAERVATARGLSAALVTSLVTEHIQGPDIGILGAPKVNVLALNRALDALTP